MLGDFDVKPFSALKPITVTNFLKYVDQNRYFKTDPTTHHRASSFNAAYTAIVRGVNSTIGVGLVEVYDLDFGPGSTIANVSTRGFVQTGENVLIGGFILGGNGLNNNAVVVRAIGPSLSHFGITNPLQDPMLEVHNASGAIIASNNNWQDSQAAQITASGLAPTDPRESAILATLSAGGYTAIVRGVSDTTGVALVEIYNLSK